MRGLNGLLSKDGRFSRRAYLLFFVIPGAALLGVTIAAFTVAQQILSSQISPAIAMGWLVYLSTMDAQNIRRYHDLGSSGSLYRLLRPLVVILPLLAFALQFLIPAQMASAGDIGALAFLINQEVAFHMSPIPLTLMAIWAVGIISNVAYLAVIPGDAGPNVYGPGTGDGAGAGIPVLQPSTGGGDPVERALAEYRAGPAQRPASPGPSRTANSPAKPAGAFGKKR